MTVTIKTPEQIEKMRVSGKLLAEVEKLLAKEVKPGITTAYLNRIAEDFILAHNATPSFKGYGGFPATLCTSINEEVVHGFPSERVLVEGDILSVDMGCILNGYHSDMARTYAVGRVSSEAQRLMDVTKQSFFEGIAFAKEGNYLNDIGTAIQKYVERNGFSVVRSFVGHGIGRNMHEDPQIPNYKTLGRGIRLEAGMTLAIEPMVNTGTHHVKVLADGWTAVTKDGKLAAHYENTILVKKGDPGDSYVILIAIKTEVMMLEYKIGQIVFSKSGHDKGGIFFVLAVQGEYLLLVDGKRRRLEKPKRKKVIHIQPTHFVDTILADKINENAYLQDADIVKAIKAYQNEQ